MTFNKKLKNQRTGNISNSLRSESTVSININEKKRNLQWNSNWIQYRISAQGKFCENKHKFSQGFKFQPTWNEVPIKCIVVATETIIKTAGYQMTQRPRSEMWQLKK